MKSTLKIILICISLVGIQIVNGQESKSNKSENLIQDEGFTNSKLWLAKAGVNNETGLKPDNCCSLDQTVGKTGLGSVLLIGNSTKEWRSMQYSKYVQVEPNKTYRISGWVKTENISKHSRIFIDYNIKYKNEIGKPGESPAKELIPKGDQVPFDKVKGTHNWELIECAYTIPENIYFLVNIRLRYNPAIEDTELSKVWFDDFKIEEAL
jgi:hypothetical protein